MRLLGARVDNFTRWRGRVDFCGVKRVLKAKKLETICVDVLELCDSTGDDEIPGYLHKAGGEILQG